MRKAIVLVLGLIGLFLAFLLGRCGGSGSKTVTAQPAASTGELPAPAWKSAPSAPKLTAALIAQAGYGLTRANTTPGTVDEVFGSVTANVHVHPSGKTLNDQYAPIRSMHGRAHADPRPGPRGSAPGRLSPERPGSSAAVEKASLICTGLAITPEC
jgi:hypothetical protein